MRIVFLALILALLMLGFCGGCSNFGEYAADRKAYKECIENEPNMDDCVFNYVKYLPINMQKELETE